MNGIYLFFLLWCTICFTKITASDIEPSQQFQQKLNDLNAKDIAIMFDQLSIDDLLRIASCDSANTKIASFLAEVFRRKYQDYYISIAAGVNYADSYRIFNIPIKAIIISSKDLAKTLLQHFGSVIQQLEITNAFSKKLLEQLEEPCEGIVDLNFEITNTESNILPLTYLFPNLHKLAINLHADSDYSFIDVVFPHLEQLDLAVYGFAWNQRDQIEGLIQKNSHIKSLSLNGHVCNYLKSISEWLPDLKRLHVRQSFDIFENDAVRFENVNHLKLESTRSKLFQLKWFNSNVVHWRSSLDLIYKKIDLIYKKYWLKYKRIFFGFAEIPSSSLNRLYFPHLEFVEFFYAPTLYEECKAFFSSHSEVRGLTLWQGSLNRIAFSEYARVASELHGLVDVKMGSMGSVEEIKAFIKSHRNLMKLELSTDSRQFGKSEKKSIRNAFENEWDIKESLFRDYQILTFERKNTTAAELF